MPCVSTLYWEWKKTNKCSLLLLWLVWERRQTLLLSVFCTHLTYAVMSPVFAHCTDFWILVLLFKQEKWVVYLLRRRELSFNSHCDDLLDSPCRLKHAEQEVKKKQGEVKKTDQDYKKDQNTYNALTQNLKKLEVSQTSTLPSKTSKHPALCDRN